MDLCSVRRGARIEFEFKFLILFTNLIFTLHVTSYFEGRIIAFYVNPTQVVLLFNHLSTYEV